MLLKPLMIKHSLQSTKLNQEKKDKLKKRKNRQSESNDFLSNDCDDVNNVNEDIWDNNEIDLMDSILHANGIDLEDEDNSISGLNIDFSDENVGFELNQSIDDSDSNDNFEINQSVDDSNHNIEFEVNQSVDNSDEIVTNVLKRGSSMICVNYNRLRFLDIINFVGPGVSLDKYLKTYKVGQTKQFFPYEYFDSLDKLKDNSLPEKDKFYSKLRDEHISDENYEHCRKIWHDNNMSTLRDYVIFYNISDVQPFLTAIERQFAFYQSLNIDMFKDAVSLPGLSVQVMFQFIPRSLIMPQLFARDNYLYKDLKRALCGGLSIILHRYHESGKTYIKNNIEKRCMKIVGLDCTNCYGATFLDSFPTGMHCRYFISECFQRRKVSPFGFAAVEWMTYIMQRDDIFIQHKFNGGEFKIHNMSVDGFCSKTNTIYEYLGCIWHGHTCYCARHDSQKNPRTHSPFNSRKSLDDLLEETKRRLAWLRSLNYTVIEIWECEWNAEKKICPDITRYAHDIFFNDKFHPPRLHDSDTILSMISRDELFGICRVNIFTPTHLKDFFAEFPPIFKSSTITLHDIGEHMKSAAIDAGLTETTNRRNLILSYYGINLWIITPLLKWYLDKKLKIEIYEFVSFTPKTCFKDYIELVTEKRRLGDVDSNSELIAQQMKLLANSSFGKFITHVEKQVHVSFGDSVSARSSINKPLFRRLEELDEDVYEINILRRNVKIELPMVIGLFVLQKAKIIILQFIYDFIKVYFSDQDIQLLSHDTDSVYIAMSAENLEELLIPSLKESYYKTVREQWFPAECCSDHKIDYINCKLNDEPWVRQSCCEREYIRQTRTPGLFKEEFSGSKFIALSPKCYFAFNDDKSKISSKGVAKNNKLQYEDFEKIINRSE